MDSAKPSLNDLDTPIVREAKEYFRHEKVPNIISLGTRVKGLLQARVLEINQTHALIGLCLVREDNTNHTLKILGEPQWVKVNGKLTLVGAPVDMDFNRMSNYGKNP